MPHRLIKPTLLSVILASTLQGMAFAQQPPEEPAPPPADAEAGADEANLAEGDRITATQSAVVLENLIGQFLYSKAEEGGSAAAPAP